MFFIVNVDLSEEGIEHVDDIVTLVFQYLNMLRAAGPQRWVFDECRKLGKEYGKSLRGDRQRKYRYRGST